MHRQNDVSAVLQCRMTCELRYKPCLDYVVYDDFWFPMLKCSIHSNELSTRSSESLFLLSSNHPLLFHKGNVL